MSVCDLTAERARREIERERKMFFSRVRPEIQSRVQTKAPISGDEYASLRPNPFEQRLLRQHLDNEALLAFAETCLAQLPLSQRPLGAYDIPRNPGEALLREVLPQLLHRFSVLLQEHARLQDDDARQDGLAEEKGCAPR